MSKSVNRLLTVQPSCCCNSLSSPSAFSPWTSDIIMQKVKPISTGSPKPYHKMISVVEDCLTSNSKLFSSSKHSLSSDSKHASIVNSKLLLAQSNHQIPYQFAHQSSSTSAIEEYRSKYTYPTLQKRVVSAHTVERNHCCAVKYSAPAPSCNNCYTRSLSESQISTMLKPRTVILEESLGKKDISDQSRKQFIPKGRVLPSPKVVIGYNQIMHPKYEVVRQSSPMIGHGLDKMSTIKCTSQTEIPTFTLSTGKLNKAKSSTEEMKKKYKYSLKPRQQKKSTPAKCKSIKISKPPPAAQKQSNALRVKTSSPVPKFGYSSSSCCSRAPSPQRQRTEDKSRSNENGGQFKYSVRMISSPWEDRRNTF